MGNMEAYYVRYTLSGERRTAVERLRERISERFGVNRARNSPPHVTLRYPFDTADIASVKRGLSAVACKTAPFVVPVIGFSAFDEAVWFIDPVQDERLLVLKEEVCAAILVATGIAEKNAWEGHHFHITLAYKDVSPETHRRIREFLRGEPLPITDLLVDSVTLNRRRSDGRRV